MIARSVLVAFFAAILLANPIFGFMSAPSLGENLLASFRTLLGIHHFSFAHGPIAYHPMH